MFAPQVQKALDFVAQSAAALCDGSLAGNSEAFLELRRAQNAAFFAAGDNLMEGYAELLDGQDKGPTLAEVKEWCAKFKCEVRRVDGEFRVCHEGWGRPQTYRTGSGQDAINFAIELDAEWSAFQKRKS